jgi:hypothetical protein
MSVVFMHRVLGVCIATHTGVTLPEHVARWEANRADNERQCVRKQRRQLRSAARAAARARGEETPSESWSSGADEEEREIISSPRSPSPKSLPSPGDLFRQQVGISTSAHRAKCSWADVGGASIPPPRSSLVLIGSALWGARVCIAGARMTYSLGVL